MYENLTSSTVTSNSLSISYTSNNAIYSISPSSNANISLVLTNVPTGVSNGVYSLFFYINTSTNKRYISTFSINGTS
jgi:hypothetical protein